MSKMMTAMRTAALGAFAMGLVMSAASAQDYPEMTLKMAHSLPETFVQSQKADKWFFEELERRSGGKIKVQIF